MTLGQVHGGWQRRRASAQKVVGHHSVLVVCQRQHVMICWVMLCLTARHGPRYDLQRRSP